MYTYKPTVIKTYRKYVLNMISRNKRIFVLKQKRFARTEG